jgi:hypothetical protein
MFRIEKWSSVLCMGFLIYAIVILKCKENATEQITEIDRTTLLNSAFIKGTRYLDNGKLITFDVKELGKLKLPNGKIVVCDPFIAKSDIPLDRTVMPGEYAVEIAVAKRDNDERVAFARIRFSTKEIVSWVGANFQNDSTAKGYNVDSGTGCFIGLKAIKILRDKIAHDSVFYDFMTREIGNQPWANVPVATLNVTMFEAGYGDGSYKSFWGLDESGQPTVLVTDFCVVECKEG